MVIPASMAATDVPSETFQSLIVPSLDPDPTSSLSGETVAHHTCTKKPLCMCIASTKQSQFEDAFAIHSFSSSLICSYLVSVTDKSVHEILAFDIPNFEGSVGRSGHEELTVPAHHDFLDLSLVGQ